LAFILLIMLKRADKDLKQPSEPRQLGPRWKRGGGARSRPKISLEILRSVLTNLYWRLADN
jgi:hypothetical protein